MQPTRGQQPRFRQWSTASPHCPTCIRGHTTMQAHYITVLSFFSLSEMHGRGPEYRKPQGEWIAQISVRLKAGHSKR